MADAFMPTYENLMKHFNAYGFDRKKNYKGVGVSREYRTYKQLRNDTLVLVARRNLTVDNYMLLLRNTWAPEHDKWVNEAIQDYADVHGLDDEWVVTVGLILGK